MVLYFLGVDGCDDNDTDKKDAVLPTTGITTKNDP